MSVRRTSDAMASRAPLVFWAGVVAMSLLWFFGIATRVSIFREENAMVSVAGISRVLTGGFPDFRDTFFVVLLAVGCYFLCLWALWKGFRHSFAAAIAGTVLAAVSMLPAMPLTSPDAVHLAADVRTFWLHGKWPAEFDGAPGRIDDPVANEVRIFRNEPSGYGPVAYALGGAPIPFVGDGFKANLMGQKVLGGIFLTLTAAACGVVARRLGQNGAFIAGIVGLNPMMTWQFAADGHNDAMMAFFGVVALGLVMEREWKYREAGIVAGAASVLTKFALVLAAPLVAVYWWPKWRSALAFATAALAGTVLLLIILDFGPLQSGTLGPAGAVIRTTPWSWIRTWFDLGPDGSDMLVFASYILYVFILGLVMLYHPLETKQHLALAVGLALTLYLYACSPGYHPWYIVWCLPFAALSGARWLISFGVAFSLLAFLPILALNWQFTLAESASIPEPVASATALMWGGTALAGWIGWRGRRWTSLGSAGQPGREGPRFAPRQRRRARA